jgi:hypothetical protein
MWLYACLLLRNLDTGQVVELTLTRSVIGWATAYEPRSKKYGDDEKVVACDERTIPGVESKYLLEEIRN